MQPALIHSLNLASTRVLITKNKQLFISLKTVLLPQRPGSIFVKCRWTT